MWIDALRAASGRFEPVSAEDATDERVRVAVVSGRPDVPLARWPNLVLVQALWHGVDALLAEPDLPDVPVARLVDPGIPPAMARFVARVVLAHTQRIDAYESAQAAREWRPLDPLDPSEVTVGVLGLGQVGRAIAAMARGLLHPVVGWRASAEPVPGVDVRVGTDGLGEVVSAADVLVNALPSTPSTRGLLTGELLSRLPDGATFVNVGRGDVVAESVLLEALDVGKPSRSHLDVFATEPLPETSPLWGHPRVRITPHVSGTTSVRTALGNLVSNLHRAIDGGEPEWLVDRTTGY